MVCDEVLTCDREGASLMRRPLMVVEARALGRSFERPNYAVSLTVLAAVPRDRPFVLDLDGESWPGQVVDTIPMVETYRDDLTLRRDAVHVETMLGHWMEGGDGKVFAAPAANL
jgi:hypothetical protein